MLSRTKKVFFFLLIFTLGFFPFTTSSKEFSFSCQAKKGFFATAFSGEYGDVLRNKIVRWEKNIVFSLEDYFTQADTDHLIAFLNLLQNEIPSLPPLLFSSLKEEANVHIHFIPQSQMPLLEKNYIPNNQGFFHYKYQNHHIEEGIILIDSSLADSQKRNAILEEEIVNLLGLGNDLTFFLDSILYEGPQKPVNATELDYEMLNILYHPNIKPGMKKEEVQSLLFLQ